MSVAPTNDDLREFAALIEREFPSPNHEIINRVYSGAYRRPYAIVRSFCSRHEVECFRSNGKRLRGMLERRTPEWADRDAIRSIYASAKAAGLSVDHIVPLCSPFVCGLHCEANLRQIPLRENVSKGNRGWQ